MPIIYLTPVSISNLTQFILAFVIAAYFLYLTHRTWRRAQKPLATMFLAGAFSSIAGYIVLIFLNASLSPDLRFYAMPLEGVMLALSLLFALQFAYHFPVPLPGKAGEAKVVFGLSGLYLLWEVQIAIYRLMSIQQGFVRYRPAIADYPLMAGFLWLLIVLLRQTMYAPGDNQRAGGLQNLWQPRSRIARAARALFFFSGLPLLLTVISLLRSYDLLAVDAADIILPLGMLFMLAVFAITYLNYLPEKTSFMVKLVGVTMVTSLVALGSIGWIITPAYVAAYRNDHFMANRQSIRFTPNSQGGYDVAAIPFYFDRDFGVELGIENMWVDLGFDFPFYRQIWDRAYLMSDGAVSFGQALDWQDTKYRYGPLPAIFPMVSDFVDPGILPAELSGGFFAKSTADKLTVTWNRLPELHAHEARYAFQLTLYPSGIFEIAYDNLPATQTYDTIPSPIRANRMVF